ncbi:cuticle protein 1-like [Pectinophora gossypiella]|uniref:cuticle protein 1-like n=1 Tax=Pectinophora gossypiella TaxID=13191 RepID=UPI00214EAAAC|nr:cuticle protein 1-like [Pectinophora gossypiella]
MRFLIAFSALLAYASASAILAPYALGINAGDAQAAAINHNVAAQDTARAIGEGQLRAAEAAVQYNTEAVRQAAETNRDIHENAYWNGVAASQNVVAAAQSQAAALSGIAAARAGHWAGVAPVGVAPLGVAPYGIAPYGLGLGHGLAHW